MNGLREIIEIFTAIKTLVFLHFITHIHRKMLLFHIRSASFLVLLVFSICTFGMIKLPLCQCECCPGEDCLSQLVVFSVEQCNAITCSFEQCYQMYPKKCGLLPGLTRPFCNLLKQTTTNSSASPPPHSSTSRYHDEHIFNVASMHVPHSIMFLFFSRIFISNYLVNMQLV